MRKREVIEFRHKIDCMGRSFTSRGRQQRVIARRDYENIPESESTAYLTQRYLGYLGGLGGPAKAVGSIGQSNGEYERRPSRSRISS